jgi:hypothetical protein
MTLKKHPAGTIVPIQPLHMNLPLVDENLSWEQFEEFCRDLVARLPHVNRVSSYGRRGDAQKGIDFPAEMASGETWSFQCRRVQNFTKSEFETTVAKDTYGADHHIILLACQASSDVRDAERGQPDWEIWDVTDVSRWVRRLSPQDRRDLVRHHFGGPVLEACLGFKGAPSFRTWEDHFKPYIDDGLLFHHRAPFVGRQAILNQLRDAVASPDAMVVVLPGRGGIGKTRILQQFGLQHLQEHPTRPLLYADENTPFSADTFQEISVAPTTLIVDDAHRREDLGQLLSFITRDAAPGTKVVLAIRPEGHDRLSAILAHSSVDATAVIWLRELTELSRVDGQRLAEEVLGENAGDLAERLYAATWDCPLVTVVGGELLRRKRVAPALLERDDAFRHEVLDRFSDAALGRVPDEVNSQIAAATLTLTSALQPVRPEHDEFRAVAAAFLGCDVPTFVRTANALEDAGLLLRRGYRVRVVPDVLADHLLYRACLTRRGATTGYVDKLFEHFAAVAFDRMLANVAELDWRIEATTGSSTQLLDGVWNVFDDAYRSGSHATQVRLLGMLTDAAVFQASRVMERVEYALDHPAEASDPGDEPSRFALKRENVLRSLANLANRCAHGGEVRRACNVLWRLGRDDASSENSNTSHPIRHLRDLASFSVVKPVSVNTAVLAAVEVWLRQPDAHAHFHSPIEILKPFLAKSGRDVWGDGATIHIQSYGLIPESTGPLRKRAVDLLTTLAEGDDTKAAVLAVKALGEVLHEPFPELGRDVTDEERASWHEDQLDVLGIFARLAARTDMPLAQITINDEIGWTLRHSQFDELRSAAARVWAATPDTFDLRALRALTQPWGRYYYREYDMEKADQLHKTAMERVADEIAERYPAEHSLLQYLAEAFGRCRSAGVTPEPAHVVGRLGERHPELATAAAWRIAQHPGHPLEEILGSLVLTLRDRDPDQALRLTETILAAKSPLALTTVGWLYAYGGWAASADQRDVEVISTLLSSEHNAVRAWATVALGRLSNRDPAHAKVLAVSIRVGGDLTVAEKLADVLAPEDSPIFSILTDEDLCRMVQQFEDLENLDGYQVVNFLRAVAPRIPVPLLEMIIRRIDRLADRSRALVYAATPRETHESIWRDLGEDQRAVVLRRLRDDYRDGGWPRIADFPRLYAEIGRSGEQALAILEEWVRSGDSERICAAASLFSCAPQNYAFDHPDVVERWFDAAEATSTKALRCVRSAFSSSLQSGIRSGQLLRPFARDVAVKKRASELAAQYERGTQIRRFFEEIAAVATADIANKRKQDEELFDGPLPEIEPEEGAE